MNGSPWWAPQNGWEFLGLLAILTAQCWQIYMQHSLHGQMNGMKTALIKSAGETGHAEGVIAGAKLEQARVATALATQTAAESRLREIRGDG